MLLRGKRVLVVGAGKSGVAVARFLIKKGAAVALTDANSPTDADKWFAELTTEGVELFLGGYPTVRRDDFDLLVVSPGVPLSVAPVQAAVDDQIPVLGELELAYQFSLAPIVAITGTNGKTTTTALLGSVFQAAGKNTLVGGNIGLPLVAEIEDYSGTEAVIVAEVSSFQLETCCLFRPKVSVILNITPDHLDRHGSMEQYIAAKAKIFSSQKTGDFIVLNADDPLTVALGGTAEGEVLFFSRCKELAEGVFVQAGNIVARLAGKMEKICAVDDLRIPGTHNLENALAAVAVAKVMGVRNQVLAASLRSFNGVAHRLEFVTDINGVGYVNDSKGTNPDASIKALEAYDRPIVLIAGGKNKGSDFGRLAEKIKEKVRVLVVLGQSADLIADAAREKRFTSILYAADFKEAVFLAHRAARSGDIVLLSPACASWDMFKNFEERGAMFKEIVFRIQRHQ